MKQDNIFVLKVGNSCKKKKYSEPRKLKVKTLPYYFISTKEQTWDPPAENHCWYVLVHLAKCVCLCYQMCVWQLCSQLFNPLWESSMVWTVPLSFIFLFHHLFLSRSLTTAKVRVLEHIFHALLCFLNIPSPPHHFLCFTAAGILFSSFRSAYANFWLDIIWNGA